MVANVVVMAQRCVAEKASSSFDLSLFLSLSATVPSVARRGRVILFFEIGKKESENPKNADWLGKNCTCALRAPLVHRMSSLTHQTTDPKTSSLSLSLSLRSFHRQQPGLALASHPPAVAAGGAVDDSTRKQDALSYLRHLKDRLKDRKQTYDEFLEIMKEFKAQR